MSERKNFKCQFNPYVSVENREGVIQSIIAQFEGYYADPEVTSEGNESFTLSVTMTEGLTPTLVRDKLLFNYFIDRVTVSEIIRTLKRRKLPVPTSWKREALLDRHDLEIEPEETVDEYTEYPEELPDKSYVLRAEEPTPEYLIDMADRKPDGPELVHKSKPKLLSTGMKKTADPTDSDLNEVGPGIYTGFAPDVTREDLASNERSLKGPKSVGTFANHKFNSKLATENDGGGLAGWGMGGTTTNYMTSVQSAPRETKAPGSSSGNHYDGIGSTTSWFHDNVTSQGLHPGETIHPTGGESFLNQVNREDNRDVKMPAFASKDEEEQFKEPKSSLDIPIAAGGSGLPLGESESAGKIKGWFGSTNDSFGFNEYYDYEGTIDGL